MKFRFRTTSSISIYFLLTFSWLNLFSDASNKNETNTLMNLNNSVFGLIINQLLTIQDILILRTTCQLFANLLIPNDEGMFTFCNYAESKGIINVDLYWINLEYFLNESYDNTLHEMKIFAVSNDRYAILTRGPDQKIISWFKTNVVNNIQSEPLIRVYTSKSNKAWVEFIKGKNGVQNIGGNKKFGAEISLDVLSKIMKKKIKTIVSTACAFAVLLDNGDVFAWGDEEWGGLIPDEIQTQLKNIRMIYSNHIAFVAVSEDGEAYSWGCDFFGSTKIPSDIRDVKMIFPTIAAFAALLNDGSVWTWGNTAWGGEIPSPIQSKLKNVKMIFSNDVSFLALLPDNGFVLWGYDPDPKLLQLVSQFNNNGNNIK